MASVKLSDIINKYEDSTVSGDFSDWIEKLELVANLQKIEDLISFLPLFLTGAAFAVYKQLSEEDKKDYPKLKAALLLAFGVNSYVAYEQLQRRMYQEGEAVDVYLADLKRLVTLMGQTTPEPLLKCAFMAGLPSNISVQLKSVAAVETLDLNGLVTRARMMMSAGEGDMSCAAGVRRQKSCFSCNGKGHFANECPTKLKLRRPRTCYSCGEVGHFARECVKKSHGSSVTGNGQGGVSSPDALPRH